MEYIDDAIIMVPVPRSQLGAVFRVLGDLAAQQVASGERSEEGVEVRGERWTVSKIRRLEAELTHQSAREFVTLVAREAPRYVTFQEAVQTMGVKPGQLRGAQAALTKTEKRLFGGDSRWPVSFRTDAAGIAYSMDPKLATWWIEASDGTPHEARLQERR